MSQVFEHKPILLKEVVQFLDPEPGDFIVDGTIDGGGHAAAILKKLGAKGKLLGIDWDENMIAKRKSQMANRTNMLLAHGNYVDLPEILKERKLDEVDGLLLDLGFSSEQLEISGRGFSFLKDEPLLMTYDKNSSPVWRILENTSENELARIIFELSGEKFSRRIAKKIKEAEKIRSIKTSGRLAEIVRKAAPKNYERGRIDPATRTFQALRIYANHELENLEKILNDLPKILKPKGRVVIISFHSLEDRIVKQNFRRMEKDGLLEIITKKPIVPSEEEILANPRSRSAKLRAARLI